jgi:hypothetical protein
VLSASIPLDFPWRRTDQATKGFKNVHQTKGTTMKTSLKTLASAALLATLVGGLPSSAKALGFVPLGEGALPSGNLVQNFQLTIYPGESVP